LQALEVFALPML